MPWSRAVRLVALTLLAGSLAGLALEGYSRARAWPTPSTRSRANDTPVRDHAAGGGPYGGQVTSVVVARTRPVATAYLSLMGGGVYRSADRGETWQPADRGLPANEGCDLVADPVDGDTLYAACDDGLFKTSDGGGLWRQLDVDHPVAPVIAAADPRVLYVGGLRSRDGGRRWTVLHSPTAALACSSGLVVDPRDADRFVCAAEDGLYSKPSGGERWTRHPGSHGARPSSLIAMPGAEDRLLAVTDDGVIYTVANQGAVWTRLGRLPGGNLRDVRSDDTGMVLHAAQHDRLVRSEDGGRTWHTRLLPRSPFGLWTYAVDPFDPHVVYLGTWDGPYVSLDGGQTWQLKARGLTRAAATVVVHEGSRSTVLAAVGAEVLGSDDGGRTWTPIQGPGFPDGAEARSLASDGAGGVRLRAGSRRFRLMAGATGWIEDDTAADGAPGAVQPITHPSGVTPTAVVSVGTAPRHLVAGIGGLQALIKGAASSLWRSLDGGATWSLARRGTDGPGVQCCALLRDPNDPDTLFAVESGMVIGGGGARLLRSIDAGATWAEAGWFQGAVSVVPTRPATLLGQPYQGGLVRSTDAGAAWTPAHAGLPSGDAVTHVTFDRRRPTTLFAATASRGVYRSEDAGVSWTPAGYQPARSGPARAPRPAE